MGKASKTYGPILTLWLGQKLTIVVSSPAIAREMLKDHDTTFTNRDVSVAVKQFAYGGGDVAWSHYSSEWRMLRKLAVRGMLSNTRLDSVYSLRREEIRKKIGYIFRNRVGSPVNTSDQMFLTLFNLVTNMLWGCSIKEEDRVSIGFDGIIRLLGNPNISDFYPSLARFDLQGIEKKMRGVMKRVDEIFDMMIDQRMKMNGKGGEKESKDFLQFLLELKDGGDEAKTPLTMAQVKAMLMSGMCVAELFVDRREQDFDRSLRSDSAIDSAGGEGRGGEGGGGAGGGGVDGGVLLLPVFCKIDQPTRCRYQNADWRLRPLPDEMLRLLSASTESENSDEPLVEGFEVIDIIFDVKHCLQGFVGIAKDVNAIVIAFKIGGWENFFHCNKCRCCYSVLLKNSHPCVEGAMHNDCPVCFEYLFESRNDVTVMPCGHTIHESCLKDMHEHYRQSVWILCNDCGTKSEVQFHIVAQKCPNCKSYNTRQIRGI
ncbi:unnamed protein product [Camellia sinensis]